MEDIKAGARGPSVDLQGSSFDDQLDPIVIAGMGMRLPGNIRTAEQLWDLIASKKTTRSRIPDDRFNAS
jgi:acyl transferase domain-containing protein